MGRAGTLTSPTWGWLASPPWITQLDGSQGARRERCQCWPRSQRWLWAGNAREAGPALSVQNEGSDFLSALH